MKRTKIQTRFFLANLVLISSVLILLSLFFYHYISRILIERETADIIDITSTFQTQTDQAVKTMDTLSINIGYSNLIMQKLEQYFSIENMNWSDTNALAELFVAINGTDSQVDQINIYDFTGNVVGFGRTPISAHMDLSETDWYQPTLALNGHKYISYPYSTDALSKTAKTNVYYISLYRTYFNKSGKQVGIVETIQNCKTIFKNMITYEKKNKDALKIYVFDESGTLIYPFDKNALSDVSYYYNSLKKDDDHIILKNPSIGDKELIAYKTSAYQNWTYVTVLPEEVVLRPVRNLLVLIFILFIVVLIPMTSLSYYMALSLTRPIKKLRNMIYNTDLTTLGEHDFDSFETSIDELDQLNLAFKTMSINLKLSMNQLIDARQQELKSRSLALQSQINPHFYYNSLSSIIILAENDQSKEVVTLCHNLSNIMRYITKGSSPIVTIGEEIDYISKYLYCMKIRYQTSLDYTMDIDPSILDIKIPRLIIQPLVENALKYGTDCVPPWRISIRSKVTDEYWKIDVTDHGNGFSKEALEIINKRIKEANNINGMPEIDIHGMGLINVYSRWKLYCNHDFIFTYSNLDEGGGMVSIGRYFPKNPPTN